MRNDLRLAVRSLIKRPGFAAAIIITLAFGIGANVAIWSGVYAFLFAPLPFDEADRLTLLWENHAGHDRPVSLANFFDWKEQATTFSAMVAYRGDDAALTGAGEPTRIGTCGVSEAFFETLGVRPSHGRTFATEEHRPGGAKVALLGHALWQSRYGGDPGIVGRAILLDGAPFEVVGVVGRDFRLPQAGLTDVWMPIELMGDALLTDRGSYSNSRVLARLAPGSSIDAARTEMDTVAKRLEAAYPETNTSGRVIVSRLHDVLVQDARPALLVLWGAVAFVLLIACVNVANLLLVRATARQQEMAIRTSLGAGRLRLVRQLLAESTVLAAIGGGLGVLLALWAIDAMRAAIEDPAVAEAIGFGLPILGFTTALILAVGLAAGLLPALAAARIAPQRVLSAQNAGRRGRARAQAVLATVQIALALLLAIAASLMTASVARLSRVDPGFDPTGLLTFGVRPPEADYPPGAARAAFYDRLLAELENVPGATGVGLVQPLPLGGSRSATSIEVQGFPAPAPGQPSPSVAYQVVTPGYFDTAGVQVVAGRAFSSRDRADGEPVALVDEAMAARFWNDVSPLGKRFRTGSGDRPWTTVVGVVRGIRHRRLADVPEPRFYLPLAQKAPWRADIVIAVAGAENTEQTAALGPAVRDAVRRIDPNLPISGLETVDDVVARQLQRSRQPTIWLAIFAAVAVALAGLGVYGVIAHGVVATTRELGVRMALGARRTEVLAGVVGQGFRIAALGLAIGLAAAIGLTRFMHALLYEVSATDPRTFLVVAITILALVGVACYLPARRAAAVDPVTALRHE